MICPFPDYRQALTVTAAGGPTSALLLRGRVKTFLAFRHDSQPAVRGMVPLFSFALRSKDMNVWLERLSFFLIPFLVFWFPLLPVLQGQSERIE